METITVNHFGKHHYSVPETCHTLGISRSQLYKLVSVGDIRPVKIGSRTLFTNREIERFSDDLLGPPMAPQYRMASTRQHSSQNPD